MRGVDRYLLRKDLAEELHDWVFFSGVSDKVYGFSKVTNGIDSYYEIPFISKDVRGFITVDTPRSISVIAKTTNGEINKHFKTPYDAKSYLTRTFIQ